MKLRIVVEGKRVSCRIKKKHTVYMWSAACGGRSRKLGDLEGAIQERLEVRRKFEPLLARSHFQNDPEENCSGKR